jgi:hypothetical protein
MAAPVRLASELIAAFITAYSSFVPMAAEPMWETDRTAHARWVVQALPAGPSGAPPSA